MVNQTQHSGNQPLEIARMIQQACIKAALEGYESAAMSGLCSEGAWEAAVSAMRMLDLEKLLVELQGE